MRARMCRTRAPVVRFGLELRLSLLLPGLADARGPVALRVVGGVADRRGGRNVTGKRLRREGQSREKNIAQSLPTFPGSTMRKERPAPLGPSDKRGSSPSWV